MTEGEWNACNDPLVMLEFLSDKATDRQFWLFGIACVRRMLGLFPNAIIRQAVAFAERDVDELARHEEMLLIQSELDERRISASTPTRSHSRTVAEGESSAVHAASWLVSNRPMRRVTVARETARAATAAVYAAANDRDAIRHAPGDEVVAGRTGRRQSIRDADALH